MEKRNVSLAEIQEIPKESLILLVGPPGAGKSTFCQEMVLNGLAADRPIMFVTTEQSPAEIMNILREKGMEQVPSDSLNFVDAFGQTVGLAAVERPDTVVANCEDLNSISMAISKLQQDTGKHDIILSFDSLTSPYLFNKDEIFKFIRLCLLKFASEGNSVVALMDEGCGKEEDLGAMMSVADGILRMEIKESSRIINVVKHPNIAPTKIEAPMTWSPVLNMHTFNPAVMRRIWEGQSFTGKPGDAFRKESGDFINIFWMNLALWGCMLWDPKRFPRMTYEFEKETHEKSLEAMPEAPWRIKLMMKLFMPRNFSKVKDMKKMASYLVKSLEGMGVGFWEYLQKESTKNEHYFRIYESSLCWPFENVGARLGFFGPGAVAGMLKAFEKEQRDWNVIETRCMGTGEQYCELKVIPEETPELKGFLESIDNTVVEKVHNRLINQFIDFVIEGKPLPERPRLGSDVSFNQMFMASSLPSLASDRYRMAIRMGGARTGKEIGERLMGAGLEEDEIIKRVIDFMKYCKVGKIELSETIRIKENCESYGLETGEFNCFFTTGFLNGLYSAVKGKHVREIRCTAAGHSYCEWEIV